MLNNGTWVPGNRNKTWFKNHAADVYTSSIVRHVLRDNDARSTVRPDSNLKRRFFFDDNVELLSGYDYPDLV